MIKEYLLLLGKGFKNLDKIFEGVVNKIKFKLLSEDKQEEIVRRAQICSGCPYNSINAQTSREYFELMGKHYETDRLDTHCAMCLCNLDFKVASLSSECGLASYNEDHPENKQNLKWNKYEKCKNSNTDKDS